MYFSPPPHKKNPFRINTTIFITISETNTRRTMTIYKCCDVACYLRLLPNRHLIPVHLPIRYCYTSVWHPSKIRNKIELELTFNLRLFYHAYSSTLVSPTPAPRTPPILSITSILVYLHPSAVLLLLLFLLSPSEITHIYAINYL